MTVGAVPLQNQQWQMAQRSERKSEGQRRGEQVMWGQDQRHETNDRTKTGTKETGGEKESGREVYLGGEWLLWAQCPPSLTGLPCVWRPRCCRRHGQLHARATQAGPRWRAGLQSRAETRVWLEGAVFHNNRWRKRGTPGGVREKKKRWLPEAKKWRVPVLDLSSVGSTLTGSEAKGPRSAGLASAELSMLLWLTASRSLPSAQKQAVKASRAKSSLVFIFWKTSLLKYYPKTHGRPETTEKQKWYFTPTFLY